MRHIFKYNDRYIVGIGKSLEYTAKTFDEVRSLVDWIDNNKYNYKIFSFFTYESSGAFSSSLITHNLCDSMPLVYVVAYKSVKKLSLEQLKEYRGKGVNSQSIPWKIKRPYNDYQQQLQKILEDIKSGEYYQINYTTHLIGEKIQNPLSLFIDLEISHPASYASFFSLKDLDIVSLSPELFLKKQGNLLRTQPMKGTLARSDNLLIDKKNKEEFLKDQKILAENVMIVDLLRNDFSKICKDVEVESLFELKTYKTVHQLVSTIKGYLFTESLFEILQATFPCGSITGAPKVRVMQAIKSLESSSRKIYTGSLFYFDGDDFISNVSIRTLLCHSNYTQLGVGGGILVDSNSREEWRELWNKAKFTKGFFKFLQAFETILWDGGSLVFFEEHIVRLKKTCEILGIDFDYEQVEGIIKNQKLTINEKKVLRLAINVYGEIELVIRQYAAWGEEVNFIVSEEFTNSKDLYLYHKTNYRDLYNRKRKIAQREGFDEVLFFNEKKELTEGSISNIFIKNREGEYQTPKLSCGLLNGIMRQKLIKKYAAKEAIITKNNLLQAKKIILCNSIRGEVIANFVKNIVI